RSSFFRRRRSVRLPDDHGALRRRQRTRRIAFIRQGKRTPERWQSGRMYLTRNQAYGFPVPWVRIPPSPPRNHALGYDKAPCGAFCFCFAAAATGAGLRGIRDSSADHRRTLDNDARLGRVDRVARHDDGLVVTGRLALALFLVVAVALPLPFDLAVAVPVFFLVVAAVVMAAIIAVAMPRFVFPGVGHGGGRQQRCRDGEHTQHRFLVHASLLWQFLTAKNSPRRSQVAVRLLHDGSQGCGRPRRAF